MVFEIIPFVLLSTMSISALEPPSNSISKPNCASMCNEVMIPYPFGIGPGCFLEERYEVICAEHEQRTDDIPTHATLKKSHLHVLNISLANSDMLIAQPRDSAAISNSSCALTYWTNDTVVCLNHTQELPDLNDTPFVFSQMGPSYNYVELTLEWGITNDMLSSNPGMISNNSVMRFTNFSTASLRQLSCRRGYQGNPYLNNGCQDIDECLQEPGICPQGQCVNWPGSYYCADNSKTKSTAIIAGTTTGIGVLFLLFLGWWLQKVITKRQETKLREKYFKQNGGLLLQQQLYSNEGTTMEKSKVFTSKELDQATDHFNENRILGQGGQGTVYKGMLVDGSIVAIKKSKIEDHAKLQQFINEVVILSQISHRNIIKLMGCCLETEVPLLVYEFVPNGTLYQYIHNPTEEFALSWETRLRIASEIAEALSYLHFAAAIPIYHRDIKSSNILLDEKYRAKIADFGTSKSIAIDQTHVTTVVQGTVGYLDPEYFQSSQFTDKSDVYSFGIVLVELLTGQKAISSLREDGVRSLATYFIHSLENDYFFDIVDTELLKQGVREEITKVACLAKRCLNLNGKNRPSMKEVAMGLEGIRRLRTHDDEGKHEYGGTNQLHDNWDVASSTMSMEFSKATSSSDDHPLLSVKIL